MKKITLLLLSILSLSTSYAQDSILFMSEFENSSIYKLVIRTEETINNEFIAVDNLTVKVQNDSTRVYFMSYSDGMVSSLMIPYSVFDNFLEFEKTIQSNQCKSGECPNSILFESGEKKKRYPIDILFVESLSSFMLELENPE